MWQIFQLTDLRWHIVHDVAAQSEAEWLATNKKELWKETRKGYSDWRDADTVLQKVKQALAEKN